MACSDALERNTTAGQYVAVASAAATSVTLIAANDFSTETLVLPSTGAVGVAGQGSVLVVPVGGGQPPSLLISDLAERRDAPTRVIPLQPAAILAGAAIVSDSIAWVADPGINRLLRVNYRTGDTASVYLPGPYLVSEAAVVHTAGKIFVATSAPPSTGCIHALWVLDAITSAVEKCINLSIGSFSHVVVGGDSLLYVVSNNGPGTSNRLSIVDPVAGQELVVINNVGPSPGVPVFHPSGRLLIPTSGTGIVEVNTLTRSVARGPEQGIRPADDSMIVALAVDQRGRVYSLDASTGPTGTVRILSAPPNYDVLRTVTVGAGPVAAAVAAVP